MEELLSLLKNPQAWTETQFLTFSTGLFILVAAFYFVFRVYRIFRNLGKSTYQPRIGRARLKSALYQHGPKSK